MSGFQEYFGETHNMVRQTVRKFVGREINPFVEEWEEQGEFPAELYRKAVFWVSVTQRGTAAPAGTSSSR